MITFLKLGTFGRLGNQMFQYSAAKSLALKNNALFAIPLENQIISKYFNLKCNYYSIQQNYNVLRQLKTYNESCFNYEQRINDASDNTSLEGYFQSEKYFENYKNIIREDFQFKEEIFNSTKKYIHNLKSDGSILVSMHVRRGDYVNLQNFHPVCDMEYYNKAISLFNLQNIKFLIFSDDIEWCKLNFKNINCIYSFPASEAEDLCAMSLCEHNIIANSSFSWWGAWLNDKKGRVVVAPRKWFGIDYQDKDTSDLYCKDWLIL